MYCYLCGKKFVIIDKLIYHLEYSHNIQCNYVCPIAGCRRFFHKRFVYKKHIKNKHNSNKSEINSNLFLTNECIEKLSTSIDSFQTEIVYKTENVQEETTFDIQSKFQEFTNVLNKSVLEFISKINSNMLLNRSLVQEIIENLIRFLSLGFLNIILDCIDHALNDTDNYIINLKFNIKTMIQMLITS